MAVCGMAVHGLGLGADGWGVGAPTPGVGTPPKESRIFSHCGVVPGQEGPRGPAPHAKVFVLVLLERVVGPLLTLSSASSADGLTQSPAQQSPADEPDQLLEPLVRHCLGLAGPDLDLGPAGPFGFRTPFRLLLHD